jgi:hypothetical protein
MSTETPWPTPLPSPHPDDLPQRAPRTVPYQDLVSCGVLVAASLVAALAVGALWRASAPAVVGVVNQGAAYYAQPEGKTFVARDGWFALYACIAAVLLAVFAFLRFRKERGVRAAVGLGVGGIAGGYLASWFGKFVGPGHGSISQVVHGLADGKTFNLPLTVRATGVIWLWPAVAAGLFFFLFLLFGPSEPEPDEQLFPVWGAQPEPEPAAAGSPETNGVGGVGGGGSTGDSGAAAASGSADASADPSSSADPSPSADSSSDQPPPTSVS